MDFKLESKGRGSKRTRGLNEFSSTNERSFRIQCMNWKWIQTQFVSQILATKPPDLIVKR
jgi:hypothetical protein